MLFNAATNSIYISFNQKRSNIWIIHPKTYLFYHITLLLPTCALMAWTFLMFRCVLTSSSLLIIGASAVSSLLWDFHYLNSLLHKYFMILNLVVSILLDNKLSSDVMWVWQEKAGIVACDQWNSRWLKMFKVQWMNISKSTTKTFQRIALFGILWHNQPAVLKVK